MQVTGAGQPRLHGWSRFLPQPRHRATAPRICDVPVSLCGLAVLKQQVEKRQSRILDKDQAYCRRLRQAAVISLLKPDILKRNKG